MWEVSEDGIYRVEGSSSPEHDVRLIVAEPSQRTKRVILVVPLTAEVASVTVTFGDGTYRRVAVPPIPSDDAS